MRHFAGFAKFCGCQFVIRHSRIRQIGVLKCFDSGLFFLAPTLRGSFFLQTCLLCPRFFLLAFLLHCGLLHGDLLAVRLGSSLERRQGKYEKCDGSNSRCKPAPRNSAFRLFRFVLLRQRRKRKRRVFRNWFDFKRSGILSFLLYRHDRRFFLYWRRRRCFRFFRSCSPLCFTEHKFRFLRRIRRILRAANKNVRHATSFLHVLLANRNDHKIPDRKRQAASQIGITCAVFFELHLTELIISTTIVGRCIFFIIVRPRFGFFFRFLVLVIFFGFFRFFRQSNCRPIRFNLLGKINLR